jgi:hypothetical protein
MPAVTLLRWSPKPEGATLECVEAILRYLFIKIMCCAAEGENEHKVGRPTPPLQNISRTTYVDLFYH